MRISEKNNIMNPDSRIPPIPRYTLGSSGGVKIDKGFVGTTTTLLIPSPCVILINK